MAKFISFKSAEGEIMFVNLGDVREAKYSQEAGVLRLSIPGATYTITGDDVPVIVAALYDVK